MERGMGLLLTRVLISTPWGSLGSSTLLPCVPEVVRDAMIPQTEQRSALVALLS
jgi:hypothetical protein